MTDHHPTQTEDAAQDADLTTRLLDAALMHVPFDGWSEVTFRAAVQDAAVDPTLARALLPRGAVDLALAFHKRGDDRMVEALAATELGEMRFRDRIALAVRLRLEMVEDKEAVRRGTTLFSLPMHAADGARAVWGTADRIWTTLGDSSRDANWYSKRATLSAVYSATVLYWLGDDSPEHSATWDFLDRRIDNVMQIEQVKSRLREAPVLGKLVTQLETGINSVVRAPDTAPDPTLPGHWDLPR